MEAAFDKIPAVNIFRFCVSIGAILGNGFLMFLFLRFPRLRRSQSTLLVLMLNICDFIIGIGALIRVTFTVSANSLGVVDFSKQDCLNANTVQSTGFAASKVIIVAIALDRFLAISKPIHYANNHSKIFPALVAVFSVLFSATLMIGGRIGVDNTRTIKVCSIANAASSFYVSFNIVYSGIFLFLLFFFYFLALIFIFIKLNSAKTDSHLEKHAFRTQLKIFITVSWVLLSCTLAYGIPAAIQLLSLIKNLGSDVTGFSSVYGGLASLVNAVINVILYLFKYHEINACFRIWFSTYTSRIKSVTIHPISNSRSLKT